MCDAFNATNKDVTLWSVQFCATYVLLFNVLLEIILIAWIYGAERFMGDVQRMLPVRQAQCCLYVKLDAASTSSKCCLYIHRTLPVRPSDAACMSKPTLLTRCSYLLTDQSFCQVKLTRFWFYDWKYICPIATFVLLVIGLTDEFETPYGGYPTGYETFP